MKRNRLLIGGVGVAAIALSTFISQSFKSEVPAKYTQDRGGLAVQNDANDFKEWLKGMMIDVETGEVITPERLNEVMMNYRANQTKAVTVEWFEQGPDNIGGRTRAILVDHINENRIWAGGVSGGLYVSNNNANQWDRVENFPGGQFISSIAQDQGGNIYVATGSLDESWSGSGLYVTPDFGATWQLVPGTASESRINRVAATKHNATVYFTTNTGLKQYTFGGSVSNVTAYGGSGSKTLAYSMDGNVIVVAAANNRTWVSLNWGQTWSDVSGNAAGQIASTGFTRIEYAISKRKSDNTYSIYAATTSSNNQGQWISLNSGATWTKHTPSTPADDPSGVIDYRNQGTYNSVVTFDPTDPKRVIVGGIDLHEWKQVINNPPAGGWNRISLWFANPTSSLYVHADNHELKWDSQNRLYIGNDGGIGVSTDLAQTFYHANRGYNVTQFYAIGYDKHGSVIGGTQDNGALYNDHTNATYKEFKRATGGDGFTCEISFFNPDVIFTSSQYNVMYRSGDGGETFNSFVANLPGYSPVGDGGEHPFHTQFHFGEYYDLNSEDSVIFVPQASYNTGDVVQVPSLATGDTIDYVTPSNIYYDDTLYYNPALTQTEYVVTASNNFGTEYDLGILNFTPFPTASGNYPPLVGDSLLVELPSGAEDTVVVGSVTPYDYYIGSNPDGKTYELGRDTFALGIAWDTLTVQDPFQSWFVLSTSLNGGELWGTRDAARLSVANPKWVRIAENLGSSQVDVAFSRDLNHMFVAAGGSISRIDGLGSVYTSDPDFETKTDLDEGATATSKTIVASGSFLGIGVNPANANDLVATQGFNGNVYRSSNAASATPTITMVGSQGGIAFYDVIIDRDDNDILFASTFNGVSLSEDGGATWTDVSDPQFFGTPSYEIRQSWRSFTEGNRRPGEIYVGTYGRGIWSSSSLLNVSENESGPLADKKKNKPTLEVYPNPARYNSTLVIDIKESNKLEVQFFNISGRMVKRIEKTNVSVGRNEVVFDASDLPQGTYIIRAQSGKQVETTKFMKM
ncbi:MAG: T9SS type A sorting domain-containing protein [Brumimicrobium sp.]|nr:T9SS type A sorting domain-containing protein [Brumimicrobium sp.]